ncbi:MAG: hypothetical protein QM644_07945 [Mobilitalea sp.]
MARKKLGMVNFFVPAATTLIVFAAIISFNSKKITTYLLDNIEPYNINNNIVGNLSNDSPVINTAKEDGKAYDGPYLVKRVIDGDTFIDYSTKCGVCRRVHQSTGIRRGSRYWFLE